MPCKYCKTESKGNICLDCQDIIQEYTENIKAGLCLKCKGSCMELDGTPCIECNGKGIYSLIKEYVI